MFVYSALTPQDLWPSPAECESRDTVWEVTAIIYILNTWQAVRQRLKLFKFTQDSTDPNTLRGGRSLRTCRGKLLRTSTHRGSLLCCWVKRGGWLSLMVSYEAVICDVFLNRHTFTLLWHIIISMHAHTRCMCLKCVIHLDVAEYVQQDFLFFFFKKTGGK